MIKNNQLIMKSVEGFEVVVGVPAQYIRFNMNHYKRSDKHRGYVCAFFI